MAKRRRNRRNRKRGHNESRQNDSFYGETLQQEFAPQVPNNSIISTPMKAHKTPVAVTPIKNMETTPRVLRSNSLVLRKKINVDTARTRSNSFVTPKNRTLAKVRNDNLNCTNLNMLFEEKLRDSVERNIKPHGVASSNLLNTRDVKFDNLMKNSMSCYTKEASPVCEKAVVKVDVGTQTAYYNNSMEYDVHSFAQIFETPKNFYAEKPVVTTNVVPSSGDTRFSPYCAPSSTPIKILKSGEIFSVAKNFINNKINEKNSFNYDFTETHKINRDEFHNPIFNKNNRVFSINKKRFFKSISPKVARNAYIKLCNKKNVAENVVPKRSPKSEYVIPKSFSPIKRNSSSSILNFVSNATGPSGSLISRFRSFHKKHSSKWADKIIEVCSWFGISIKMGLLAMYNRTKSDATVSQCTCDGYKSKLDEICKRMSELDDTRQKEVSVLSKEVAELRTEVRDLSQLRQELEAIKVALANAPRPSVCADHTPKPPPPPPPPFIPMAVASAPPPPPPPIPPPMPLFTSTPISRGIKINRNAVKEDKSDKENGRPVISLDDILKVKLRKAGDRGHTPKLQRRSTQPVISMDMLKQVKLRPASRPSTPTFAELSLPSTGISSPLPTSPASSLVKMLNKVDTNSCRVKRLKRVGAYSSDDLSRRMHQFRTREHGGLA